MRPKNYFFFFLDSVLSLISVSFLILYVMDANQKNAILNGIYFIFYCTFTSAVMYLNLK